MAPLIYPALGPHRSRKHTLGRTKRALNLEKTRNISLAFLAVASLSRRVLVICPSTLSILESYLLSAASQSSLPSVTVRFANASVITFGEKENFLVFDFVVRAVDLLHGVILVRGGQHSGHHRLEFIVLSPEFSNGGNSLLKGFVLYSNLVDSAIEN